MPLMPFFAHAVAFAWRRHLRHAAAIRRPLSMLSIIAADYYFRHYFDAIAMPDAAMMPILMPCARHAARFC